MHTLEKEIIIEKLNFVIYSKSSSLSSTDLEFLVTIREQIKRTSTKSGVNKILSDLLKTIFLSP
jgi:hypothetical protein